MSFHNCEFCETYTSASPNEVGRSLQGDSFPRQLFPEPCVHHPRCSVTMILRLIPQMDLNVVIYSLDLCFVVIPAAKSDYEVREV
jgi:hypothetical protein